MDGRERRGVGSGGTVREATVADVSRLVELMSDFFAEAYLTLDRDRAGEVFMKLLADMRLGEVGVITLDGGTVGYYVLIFAMSMEYGDLVAWLDDLYVQPAVRGRGLGSLALAHMLERCHARAVRALSVEVSPDNVGARHLYASAGMTPVRRDLLTLSLGETLNG